jgi:hypothetical protein
MQTIKDIEDAMADAMLHPLYSAVIAEYQRLLAIMGNVDGDEVIALVMVALRNRNVQL